MSEREPWVMPDWLVPFVPMIRNTGGPTLHADDAAIEWIEDMMNDHSTNAFNNVIRAGLIVAVESQIGLLSSLRERGLLGV